MIQLSLLVWLLILPIQIRDLKQLIAAMLLISEQFMHAGQDLLEPVASWYAKFVGFRLFERSH